MNIENAVDVLMEMRNGADDKGQTAIDMAIKALNYDWTELNDFLKDKTDYYRTDPYPPVRYMVVDDLNEIKRYFNDYKMDVIYEGTK